MFQCIFFKNFRNFDQYLQQYFGEASSKEELLLPELLFNSFPKFYQLNNDKARLAYKLLFHSYCKAYNNQFQMTFKFFILLLRNLGFDCTKDLKLLNFSKIQNMDTSLDKSTLILAELLNVLLKNNNTLDFVLHEITFTKFLQNIVLSVIYLVSRPNTTIIDILCTVTSISPLSIEPVIGKILTFIMLANNSSYILKYEQLMISIFQVFAKLHRIEKLISTMLPALKLGLEATVEENHPHYKFRGVNDLKNESPYFKRNVSRIFSQPILKWFSQYITGLASWQVINLIKTFMFHLEYAVTNTRDGMYTFFILTLCVCVSSFCMCIKSVEHASYH